MLRGSLTMLELDVLCIKVRDTRYQVVVLTDNYHGQQFNPDELAVLRQVDSTAAKLELIVRELRDVWRRRVLSGQESNRSDTRGSDAPGPARPSDDVPPNTAR